MNSETHEERLPDDAPSDEDEKDCASVKTKSLDRATWADMIAIAALIVSVVALFRVTTVETNLSEKQAKGNLSATFGHFESWLNSFRPSIQDSVSMGLSIAASHGSTTVRGYPAQAETDEICRRLRIRIRYRWSDLDIEVRSTLVALGEEETPISNVSSLAFFAKEYDRLSAVKDSALIEIDRAQGGALGR